MDHSFANDLIKSTILNASRLKFYKKHWEGVNLSSISSVDDLSKIPLLRKRELLNFLSGFQHTETPALVSHSSGTSGSITVRCRSVQELKALWNVRSSNLERKNKGLIPLVLSVEGANHGHIIPMPSAEFGLKAVGFDHAVVDHVLQQLTQTYNFPGVSTRIQAIDAPLGFVKMLSLELLKANIDPVGLNVGLLSTYGEYVTPQWSSRLRDLWNAHHIDRYANSEAIGGAMRCERCGWFSFLPESWPEVVEINSGQRIDQGIGALAMTELYPFSQLQPLIRFLPGDLMEVRPVNCDGKVTRTFRYLGRIERALTDNQQGIDRVLLYPAEVANCLDDLHCLRREKRFHTLPLSTHTTDLAAPYCKLRLVKKGKCSKICIELVPNFSVDVFPDAAESLKQKTLALLLDKCTGLKELIGSGEYDIVIKLNRTPKGLRGFEAS